MAAIKQLAAVTRSGIGKGAARSVRREGRVPGVIYGGGEKAEPISVDFKELNKHIYSGHFLTSIFELELDGRKQRVLPRDYQLDVVTDKPVHVDFFRLKAGSRVRIAVPVHVANRELSPGIKKGGAVNLVLHSVELLAPAESIPEFDHHRPHRSRLPRFGARLGARAARRLPARRHQDRLHRGDRGAADCVPGRDAGRRRRDFGRSPGRRSRCACRRRRSGQGRRRGPGQGRRRRAGQAGRQEVTLRLHAAH